MNWRLNLLNPIIAYKELKAYNNLQTWYPYLREQFTKPYMNYIRNSLIRIGKFKTLCPNMDNLFRTFKECKYNDVKVVILGQDPYHTEGTADGLAFSTKQDNTPASLKNIFKEIERTLPNTNFVSNDLTSWANQGVMLLNVYLSTELHTAKAHRNIGWHLFTEKVLEVLNNHNNKIVFMLWGNDAKYYKKYITNDKHLVLTTSHPSPLSADKGFSGCNHFKLAHDFLVANYGTGINYSTI